MSTSPTSLRLYRVLDKVSATMVILAMVAAGVSVATIIAVNSIDTLGRAFFSKPLTGAVELTELFLAMCIILAIPYAQRNLAHIEIDMIKQKCNANWQKFFLFVAIVLSVLVYFMLTTQSYSSAKASVATFEFSAGYINVPIWIGRVSVTIGFGIALLESVKQLISLLLFGRLTLKEAKPSAH